MTHTTVNRIIAGALFLLMLVVYLMTVAPSISFWDCGEFVTCSFIMGIPHPPGSPLLSLVGRVMSLIPFHDFRGGDISEIAFRVNMIDVFLGALTVMLTYLLLVRLIHKFRPWTGDRLQEAMTLFAAAATALVIGFSDEFWTNAVEIETYMPSIFMSVLAFWLALLWDEKKNDPRSLRYLFLAAYIIGLGNGVHLMVLLAAPTVAIIVLLGRPDWFSDVRFWLATAGFIALMAAVKLFAGFEILYGIMALLAFVAPVVLHYLARVSREVWQKSFLCVVFCFSLFIIGFSVYPTVIVRAMKKPAINEGNPDTWERYRDYMERKQYGQANMYTGAFTRKASSDYQFNYMYARYLLQQFPIWGPTFSATFSNGQSADDRFNADELRHRVPISILLMLVLLYGLYYHFRKNPGVASAFMLFFIANSVGLVLYLNMENPQVRERAYFFLGSFYMAQFWICMGIFGIMSDVLDRLRVAGRQGLTVGVAAVLFAVFATLPPAAAFSHHLDPEFSNFEVHNRSGDWAPRDYGYNILVSCEADAILFTNGDNDTFPLWYLQEVEGFRKDVRVVNLSLLNTDWYILQMKNEGAPVATDGMPYNGPLPGYADSLGLRTANVQKTLPVEFTEEYVRDVLTSEEEDQVRKRLWPVNGKEVSAAGITWMMPPGYKLSDEYGLLRIQDVMVYNIVRWVNWTRPIYFAVTVAQENKIGLSDYLSMEGMVYRLEPERAGQESEQVNLAALDRNIFSRYLYHDLADPEVYKPLNTRKLVTNYFVGFAQLADSYAALGDTVNALRAAHAGIDNTPNNLDNRLLLYRILSARGLAGELEPFLTEELLPTGDLAKGRGSLEQRLDLISAFDNAGMSATADSLLAIERQRLGSSDPQVLFQFGSALLQRTMYERGLTVFNELATVDSTNPRVFEVLMALNHTMGRYGDALVALDRGLAIAPTNENFKQSRQVIVDLIAAQGNEDSLTATR